MDLQQKIINNLPRDRYAFTLTVLSKHKVWKMANTWKKFYYELDDEKQKEYMYWILSRTGILYDVNFEVHPNITCIGGFKKIHCHGITDPMTEGEYIEFETSILTDLRLIKQNKYRNQCLKCVKIFHLGGWTDYMKKDQIVPKNKNKNLVVEF